MTLCIEHEILFCLYLYAHHFFQWIAEIVSGYNQREWKRMHCSKQCRSTESKTLQHLPIYGGSTAGQKTRWQHSDNMHLTMGTKSTFGSFFMGPVTDSLSAELEVMVNQCWWSTLGLFFWVYSWIIPGGSVVECSLEELVFEDCPGSYPTAACPPLLMWGATERGSCCWLVVQYTPILVEKSGVAPDITPRFTAHRQARMRVREQHLPWGR